MSLALHELLVCCRGLENEKATERKKEVDRFRRLIRSPDTVEELDRTSGCKGSKQLTWDAVFRFLQKFLQKETELLQSGKANVSATTHANRQKKMQEISSLMKYFIRCANQRGPKLKCAELISHVVEVLQSPFSCAAYGEDYSSILLKNILSVRKYWCEMSQQQWHSECLLDLYCGLFNKGSKSGTNRVQVSRIVYTVVWGCCVQTEGLSHTLFNFFLKALKRYHLIHNLVSAVNVFLHSVLLSNRKRVCGLGEEVLSSMLRVYTEMRPSLVLKEELVKFFHLQLCVHHPRGAKTLETGAYAEDWVRWQGQLCTLYDALVSEISQIGSRGKYATGSRHIAVKESLIELTADVCHQLFNQSTPVSEATTSFCRDTQRDSPQCCKRRRIEPSLINWEVIRSKLQPHHSDFDMIPWLQVTAALISRYPSIRCADDLVPLLGLLCQLQGEQQRRGERGPYVLRCLREVALCHAKSSANCSAHAAEAGRLWGRVWALALRGVGSVQTGSLCLELLRIMVQESLVPVDREFWKVFSGAVCKPSLFFFIFDCIGTKSALSEEHLSRQDLAFLSVLGFLSLCASSELNGGFSFKPLDTQRKLLKLLDLIDFSQMLHLHMVIMLFNVKLYSLSLYSILGKSGKCTSAVRVALRQCLLALLEVDPCCKWAELTLREAELPVSVVLSSHLADAHHHVCMLAALSVERLAEHPFSVKAKMLPLKNQQMAFENIYLKAQEGMRGQKNCPSEDLPDETFNRRAVLLKSVSMVMSCSPVCEKQALFALVQSYKENSIDEQLIKKQIDGLICNNLADIVVELLMTLHETEGAAAGGGDLQKFTGELDPAPNPPFFSSYVIKATLDYLSKCHSANHKSLVAILSKTPMSIQKILIAICQKAAETTNGYERHRILMMYHLFVSLLLREVKDGLGGAWAFVLRDIIYTLIHHINSRSQDEVSTRSLSLCCDLLSLVCQTAVQYCDDALESHLQVIVGTLTAQVTDQSAISQQVLSLLRFLVIENPENSMLRNSIPLLEPFPDRARFRDLRAAQHALKYSSGAFTLRQEIEHFLSVTSCDSLPLARLEGLKDLKRQLHSHKQQIGQLLKESDPASCILVKLVLNLLQLCKIAANHPGGGDILKAAGRCLGELGPVDLSSIALHHGKDQLYARAADLFPDVPFQWIFIILNCMDNALTHHSIAVRQAAGICLKDILATQCGIEFGEMYKSKRDPLLAYLNPFRRHVPRQVWEALHRLDNAELWLVQPGGHKDWLKNLCMALLDSGGVRNEALLLTRPLCEVKTEFCQRMLPLFVHDILLGDVDGSWRQLLSTNIQSFFNQCRRPSTPTSRPTTPMLSDSGTKLFDRNKTSLRSMMAVIDYLRQQSRPVAPGSHEYGTVCDSNFWLDLNYLEVAGAAQMCSAHFTALLYSEIYVDKIRSDMEQIQRRITFEESSQTLSISSVNEKSLEDSGISLQDLLIEVYRCIGEPDSLYGCGGGKLISPLTRIRTYEHEAMWDKALVSYDLHSNLPEVTRQTGIVEGLQNFGLCSILNTYLHGLEKEGVEWGPELRELRFQAAWRNTQWDCDLNEKLKPGINESLFNAVQALRDREFSLFEQTLNYARGHEVEELCRGSLEAVSSLYPALCNLQRIRELQSVEELFSRPVTDSSLNEVYRKWQQHSDLLTDSDFSLVEPVLALRSSIQETLISSETDPDRKNYLISSYSSHLMELCKLARSAGHTQLAERAVFHMKRHSLVAGGGGGSSSWAWQLEEAQVFWVKKEHGLALGLLKQMIHKLEDLQVCVNPAVVPVYSECLRLCGSWLAESCLESPAVILEKYLERVKRSHILQKTQAFFSLARFSDAQYQSIENYMKSSEFENKHALLEKAKEEVDLMRERKVSNNRYTVKVQRELELDVKALANLQADRNRFLLKAVENYIQCLELGEEHDTWVFRLASLWLENADVKAVNEMMKRGVKQIPSYKFLPLMYQLAARMGTKVSSSVTSQDVGFHHVLNELICQSSLDHPHHTLFIILALVNANKDETFSRSRSSKSTARQPSPLDLERANVARKIIDVVRKKRAKMVKDIEMLCNAYITLAYMDASQAIPIPPEQPIMQIKDLDDVIIPTMDIKVDPSGRYEDLVTISSFKPHFHLAGGVNLPKIIDCVGSDGKSRRQLVKGQDDLRQDAVMQQVFHMCSTLLQRNAETRKRKLNIRRYKVVPFSQRSGVLEWCSGTVPIGEFLVDPQKGAHKRFRTQDWPNMSCRKKMMEAQRLEFDDKLQAFTEVCQNFRPVFRYFCMERFLDPAVWLERQLAYTRSVATSSIVGYIVGLGDRHIQNILIDEQTAELVHIDLGVAFEQGKILPTPETVPFRLSRDIVDGMGITGVEGVFRRCCEKTMEVMRSSQEALLTIVEVLLYDPLFDWTMNPLKAFYLQQHDEHAELNATLNPTPGDEIDAHRKARYHLCKHSFCLEPNLTT
uniref:Serine-protein kinase ATM n=1 Tax=Sinocyclocheilus grahami TaxID=75366 RepID=A0A672RVT5_SINGR